MRIFVGSCALFHWLIVVSLPTTCWVIRFLVSLFIVCSTSNHHHCNGNSKSRKKNCLNKIAKRLNWCSIWSENWKKTQTPTTGMCSSVRCQHLGAFQNPFETIIVNDFVPTSLVFAFSFTFFFSSLLFYRKFLITRLTWVSFNLASIINYFRLNHVLHHRHFYVWN